MADVGRLLKSLPIILFFLWTVAIGICTAMVWQFLFWHIEDISGLSCEGSTKTLQGLVSAIQSFGGEIPFMFLSGKITLCTLIDFDLGTSQLLMLTFLNTISP